MTELLFLTDSYVKTFNARVIDLDEAERAVCLDRTAFYPGGGGQPHDVGHLVVGDRTLPVTKVKRRGRQVWHGIEGPLPAVGTMVMGRLDWPRRYRLMRTHTALHVVCGVVWRDYRALVTGSHMEPLRGRLDFEFEGLRRELIDEIERKVNAEIERGRPVRVKILPRAEAFQIPDLIRTKVNLLPEDITEVRVVDIVGLDLQADGGTHVANTREVGRVRIADYRSKGRINKRIYIELDEEN
ncbi:MAG: alanyl-tRNA editing protein [Acidobacteria bacterium]|nr:MAG: alanyl-tRNA editing protein [Acidobacteriota bacterium]